MPARSDTRRPKADRSEDAPPPEAPKRAAKRKGEQALSAAEPGSVKKLPRKSGRATTAERDERLQRVSFVTQAPKAMVDVRLRPRKHSLETSGVGTMSESRAAGTRPGGGITIRTSAPNGAGRSSAKQGDVASQASYRPSEAEPFMNERQRNYFRDKLIAWKADILRQNQETLHGLHADSAQFPDVADRATSETDRALELRARDRQRKLMAKIDAALARIEEGTYGYCEETGEPISLKRLDARPIATMSLEAQEKKERMERVFRED